MMTSYFMTILPLPAIDSVTPESATMLLTPFDAVRRWLDGCSFVLTDFSTYKDTFTNPDFLQIVFNILLLLPFGVYLRYYFNRRWYQVLLLSFLYSLFFECTQLSGLYGIYPYPYRFFEVDDLICNTLGGMIGFWITPALLFFLPSRKRLDETAYRRGSEVSSFRRLFGLLADYTIILGVYFCVWKFTDVLQSFSHSIQLFLIPLFAFCYFTVCAILFHGTTFGKFLVSIRLERTRKEKHEKARCGTCTGFTAVTAGRNFTSSADSVPVLHFADVFRTVRRTFQKNRNAFSVWCFIADCIRHLFYF